MRRVVAAVFSMLVLLVPATVTVTAAAPITQVAVCTSNPIENIFGFQPWYACLKPASDGSPRIEKLDDIWLIVFPLVDMLAKAAVYVAAGFIFFMLIKMAMARGDTGKIATTVSGMRDAIIGLIIAMVAVGIVNLITGAFIPKP